MLRWSLFFSGRWSIWSSFFLLLLSIPLDTHASFAFMYLYVLWSSYVTILGKVLFMEKKKYLGSSPAWKVVNITWSFVSSTCNTSLLKRSTYCLNDSSSACRMFNRWPMGFLWRYPPMKWQTKLSLRCSNLAIVRRDSLLNHTLAAPFRVIGNALHMTSFGIICRFIMVLKDSIWCRGSFNPLKIQVVEAET